MVNVNVEPTPTSLITQIRPDVADGLGTLRRAG
jgi:hypothetical protein